MTRLIVSVLAIYVAVVATLAGLLADPAQLFEPVPWYRLAAFWVVPEASVERLIALAASGRVAEGWLYAAVVGLSFGLLGGLALTGIGHALTAPTEERLLPRREAALFLWLLLALVLVADPVGALARDLEGRGVVASTGLNAMPAYWIATTVVSCSLFARYAALMAHDAAAWARAGWRRLGTTGWRGTPS